VTFFDLKLQVVLVAPRTPASLQNVPSILVLSLPGCSFRYHLQHDATSQEVISIFEASGRAPHHHLPPFTGAVRRDPRWLHWLRAARTTLILSNQQDGGAQHILARHRSICQWSRYDISPIQNLFAPLRAMINVKRELMYAVKIVGCPQQSH